MWLYRTGHSDAPIVLYDYRPTSGGDHPRNFLQGFSGYLHVDGYPGYHKVKDATLVGCWAHARRKYDEALKAMPPMQDKTRPRPTTFCNQLFAIERDLAKATTEERHTIRQERSLRFWMLIWHG